MATVVTSSSEQQRCKNGNLSIDNEQQQQQQLATSLVTSTSTSTTTTTSVVYDVEHLATFSTTGSHETSPSNNRLVPNDGETNISSSSSNSNKCFNNETLPNSATVNSTTTTTTPKVALQRLFELEKQSGIWTQRMQIELQDDFMLIVDCETNSVVERFERECVTKPEAFNEYNDIYNNIVVFIIQQSKSATSTTTTTSNKFSKRNQNEEEEEVSSRESSVDDTIDSELLKVGEGELHIFQCVSHKAQQLVSDILTWKIQPTTSNKDKNKNMANLSTSSENNKDNSSPSSHRDMKRSSKQQEEKQTAATAAMSTKLSNQKSDLNKSTEFNKISPSSANKSLGISSGGSSNSNGKPVVTVASSSNTSENVPIVNVNVKETVQVFNQIAALREKSKPSSPINPRPLSDASVISSQSNQSNTAANGPIETNGQPNNKDSLSPSGQFYKQKSIRATLAPKYATSTGYAGSDSPTTDGEPTSTKAVNQTTTTHSSTNNHNNNSTNSNTSTSSAASSSEPTKSSSAYHHNHHLNSTTATSHANNHPKHPASSSSSSSLNQRVEQKMKHNHHMNEAANSSIHSSSVSRAPQTSQQHHKQHQEHSHHKSNKSLQSRGQQQRTSQQSDSSRSHASSSQSQLDQVSTNESYVSVLNHCFDDIEKFITRLQQAVAGQAALRDIHTKRTKSSKRSGVKTTDSSSTQSVSASIPPSISASEFAILNAKARGPSEDDYFEILSKFKLAFNLLAKLKGCIHEPNAPELVHFLFTPLVIIIESARNATPPIDPTLVGIPYLNQDALDLLSNCCTSKESDVWISLGPNWTQTIDANLLKASRLPSSFQPIFSDGWAPIIGELELIGLVVPSTAVNQHPINIPVNSTSIGDCVASTITTSAADEGPNYRSHRHHHHHHHHHNRGHGGGGVGGSSGESRRGHVSSSSYGLDELNTNSSITSVNPLDSGYSAGMMSSNGRSVDGLNSHLSGRDYNKKRTNNAPASSSHGRRAAVVPDGLIGEPAGSQSYINSMPYDFINDPTNNVLDSHELVGGSASTGYRDRDNSLRNLRSFNHQPINGRHSRSLKTSSNSRHSDLPPIHHTGYDSTSHYPPPMSYRQLTDDDSRANMDLIAHHNGNTLHSDDYNEPPDNYLVDDHHLPKNLPGPSSHYYREDKGSYNHSNKVYPHKGHKNNLYNQNHSFPPYDSDYISETEHEAMLLDLGPAQTEWFFELQARDAMIVRVLFTREANNDKELSVTRGEILEVLDDSRKWWRTRNIDLQVAHVPHTIVAIMHGYQTLEELLIENPGEDPNIMTSQQYARRDLQPDNYNRDQWRGREDRRGPKTSGPFRYF